MDQLLDHAASIFKNGESSNWLNMIKLCKKLRSKQPQNAPIPTKTGFSVPKSESAAHLHQTEAPVEHARDEEQALEPQHRLKKNWKK